jgi:pimeloyl-ACP methyl ester carboxylesterase
MRQHFSPDEIVSRYALSGDGTRLGWHAHLRRGPTPRTTAPLPVVLTNGLSTTENFWRPLVAELALDHDVVHWSYRGHHDSESSKTNDYALTTHADDLFRVTKAMLHEAGVSASASASASAVHVAFSMGVTVLLEFYRVHPEMVRAMVLIAGGADAPYSSSGLYRLPGLRSVLRSLLDAAAPRANLLRPLSRRLSASPLVYHLARQVGAIGHEAPREEIERFFSAVGAMDLEAYFGTLSALLGAHGSDVLPRIGVPVLIIAPERDVMTLRGDLEHLRRSIPSAEFVLLRGTGHAVLLEAGHEVAEHVAAFLRRLD